MKKIVIVAAFLLWMIGVIAITFCLFGSLVGVLMVTTEPLIAEVDDFLANDEYSPDAKWGTRVLYNSGFRDFFILMVPLCFTLVVMGVHVSIIVFCVRIYRRIVERIGGNLLKILSRRGGVEA